MFRTLILACALLFVPGQQQRPLTDIAFDLERIAAELRARPETLVVPTGGDVNATLAAAKGGDTVVLQAGVRYVTGGAPLQAKNGVVTVTSSAALPTGALVRPMLPCSRSWRVATAARYSTARMQRTGSLTVCSSKAHR
jgi:hypothetical protein